MTLLVTRRCRWYWKDSAKYVFTSLYSNLAYSYAAGICERYKFPWNLIFYDYITFRVINNTLLTAANTFPIFLIHTVFDFSVFYVERVDKPVLFVLTSDYTMFKQLMKILFKTWVKVFSMFSAIFIKYNYMVSNMQTPTLNSCCEMYYCFSCPQFL